MSKISTFINLPFGEKLAFAEAALLLGFARLVVRFVPFSRWRKQVEVGRYDTIASVTLEERQRDIARMVARTIGRVGRNVPVEFVCLPQALTARWMLSRRGVPTEMFIGTKHAAQDNREFHAWLKVGKMIVTGHCDESEYVVLGSQRSA